MKEMVTYLTFDGNCKQAMEFYKKCFNAELQMMPFGEQGQQVPPAAKDRIMHARMTAGRAVLMASDTMPGMEFQMGNNFSVSVHCESKAEVDQFYNFLKEGGRATMPCQDTFWGAYFGMCTDRFGVNWMFNFETGHKTK